MRAIKAVSALMNLKLFDTFGSHHPELELLRRALWRSALLFLRASVVPPCGIACNELSINDLSHR